MRLVYEYDFIKIFVSAFKLIKFMHPHFFRIENPRAGRAMTH
jgi:hypothetical protein